MGKRQIRSILIKSFPFVLILFFLSACATSSRSPKTGAKSKILHDVVVFRDLKQIDLDNDGTKDIIAIYSTNVNSSGVKVIKFHGDKGDVIFERSFNNPPGVKLVMDQDTPMLIVERTNEASGRKIKDIYRWDGKSFELVSK
ncbi:MAG: hypothetical protein ABIH75_00345 [Candidatus Omnitrophota bacterium]